MLSVARNARSERLPAGHDGPVSCVDMREDGTLVTGGYDGALLIWSPAGRVEAVLTGHAALVNAVAWSPDGARIASASSDRTARVWDAARGACTAVLAEHDDDVNSVAWSPDGARAVTGSFDGAARVFDASTGSVLARLRGHRGDVNGVAWSPDGAWIATASDDGTGRIWHRRGELRRELCGHTDWVDQVAFSPDGALVATASLDRTARVWSVASGAEIACLDGHACTVKAVRWSPCGRYLATAAYDKRIRVFERATWREVQSVRNARMWNRTLAWSWPGRIATGSFGGAPVRWRIGEAEARTADRLGTPGINGMALAPDARVAALACDDGGARLVEVATGRILRERFDHEGALLSAAWSRDGRSIAFGGWDDRVSVYRDGEREPAAWIAGTGDPVNALAFSPGGDAIALGSFMGTLSVWDAASGAPLGRLGTHRGSIKSLAALGDGRWISGGRDGCLRVHGGAEPRAIEVGPTIVNGVAVSPDGRAVACASRARGVEVFDLRSGARRASFRGAVASARTVAFAPDGKLVAAGCYDGHLVLLDPATGAARLSRPFGATPLSAVAFADEANLVVATWDPRGRFGVVDCANGAAKVEHAVAGRWS
jgi:WD40 repeat protein